MKYFTTLFFLLILGGSAAADVVLYTTCQKPLRYESAAGSGELNPYKGNAPVRSAIKTAKGDKTHALLCGLPGSRRFVLRGVVPGPATKARLLGEDLPLEAEGVAGELAVELPERVPVQPAYAIELTGVSWQG